MSIMKNKTFLILSLSLLWVFNLSGVLAQSKGSVVDKIAARVDNHIILKSDVEKMYQQILMSGKGPANAQEARCIALQQLVQSKVMYAKAEIDSVIVDSKDVESELDRRMQYFIAEAGSQAKLEQAMGASISELKSDLREQVKEQLTLQKMEGVILEDVKITPAQVEEFYGRIPKDSIPLLPAEVKVGQIVILPEVSKEEKQRIKEQLLEFKGRLQAGEDFATLARQYSEDPGSAARGGDLGWQGRGNFVSEFEEIALSINPGEIADPVESEFGFHLIQLLERRGGRYHARHILLRPRPSMADMDRAKELADSVRNLIAMDSISFEKAAQEYSKDMMTRTNAGYFKDNETGDSFVAVDALDPNVFFAIDRIKEGEYTIPERYRMEDGKDAVRFLFYKASRPPHYANLKDDFQKLYQTTLNSQKSKILSEWMKKVRKDVFIDIDEEYSCANMF